MQISDGEVKIRAKKSVLAENKRVKKMVKRDPNNCQIFIIVGGGKNLLMLNRTKYTPKYISGLDFFRNIHY